MIMIIILTVSICDQTKNIRIISSLVTLLNQMIKFLEMNGIQETKTDKK